ncbi:MAG: hypothetical protein JWR77_102 [Rhizorhabdus sp.]|nr:hypothetical protein [Rhizorhabdus sp.]
MLTLLMFAPIAAAAPTLPPRPMSTSAARRVIEQQLLAPPRLGAAAGLTAEEADAVVKRNIEQIGKPLAIDRTKVQ